MFVVVGALGAAFCLGVLALRLPSAPAVFAPRLRPSAPADRWPAQLVLLARVVEWSAANGLDAHTRLRPVLGEIADVRLARRGLRLDRDAAEARRLLGPAAWELVRPDRPPQDRDAPGVAPRRLEEILDALEEL